MYMKDLTNKVRATSVHTYADDTYVVVAEDTLEEVDEKVQACIDRHVKFLNEKSMVCNISKTELVNLIDNRRSNIKVQDQEVASTTTMKILGIWLDHQLKWNIHTEKLVEKTTKILNGIKIIRRKSNTNQLQKIITSQVFGVL